MFFPGLWFPDTAFSVVLQMHSLNAKSWMILLYVSIYPSSVFKELQEKITGNFSSFKLYA